VKNIFLDSAPLALLTQRHGVIAADSCRQWLGTKIAAGCTIAVPEIIDYELRRELIRSSKVDSITRLDNFIGDPHVRYIELSTGSMRLAARLWADLRNRGTPTAPDEDIDVDVIAAAQAIHLGIPLADCVMATANVAHLGRLMPAELWEKI